MHNKLHFSAVGLRNAVQCQTHATPITQLKKQRHILITQGRFAGKFNVFV